MKVSPSGDAESLNELSKFCTAITTGLMVCTVWCCCSAPLQPLTILFSLPLSIGGAVGALLLTGMQLTTPGGSAC